MNGEAPLTMPRRLAIQLLHEAQIAAAPFTALVQAPLAADAEPDTFSLLRDDAMPQPAVGRRVWALYLHRPGLPLPPSPEYFQPQPALLRLTASLVIKGVLQLRAWRLEGDAVRECELHIHD